MNLNRLTNYGLEIVVLLSVFLIIGGCARQKELPERLLLKDWMPESIYQVQKTDIRTPKYPVIDMHAHDYATTSEEVARRVEIMNEAGIEKSVVFTAAIGAEFDSIYALYSEYPDRFDVYCGFDYSGYQEDGFGPEAVAELERCVSVGAAGVGELGDKGQGMSYCPTKTPGMHP
ncbi:MAG TPA: amidohydrolase, partial [bacterium]|nr:amidohydrolase [bacterium]